MARTYTEAICYLLDSHTVDGNGCWIIRGSDRKGYRSVPLSSGKSVMAHRLMYQHFHGELVDGLVVNHKCANKQCFNPDHLEQVTNSENVLHGYRMGLNPGNKIGERKVQITLSDGEAAQLKSVADRLGLGMAAVVRWVLGGWIDIQKSKASKRSK